MVEIFLSLLVQGIEARALRTSSKHFSTELDPQTYGKVYKLGTVINNNSNDEMEQLSQFMARRTTHST